MVAAVCAAASLAFVTGCSGEGSLGGGSREVTVAMVSNSPFGIGGPKGMDPKVVKILHDAFKKGSDEPSYQETLAKLDQEPFYLNTADYRAYAEHTFAEQKQLMGALGFKPE